MMTYYDYFFFSRSIVVGYHTVNGQASLQQLVTVGNNGTL